MVDDAEDERQQKRLQSPITLSAARRDLGDARARRLCIGDGQRQRWRQLLGEHKLAFHIIMTVKTLNAKKKSFTRALRY